MEQAAHRLGDGDNADTQQEAALGALDEAQRRLQLARRAIEEELARKKKWALADRIESLKQRQETLINERALVDARFQRRQEWTRAAQASLQDLVRGQANLAKDARIIAGETADGQAVFAAILGKTVAAIERAADRLRQKDVGETTRQIQTQVVRDFEALLQQLRQPAEIPAESPEPPTQPDVGTRTARELPQGKALTPSGFQARGNGLKAGQSTGDRRQLADLYKDVWGHLPATVRPQMDVYARERFMLKYSQLIEQYYATLAEKGRHKEN